MVLSKRTLPPVISSISTPRERRANLPHFCFLLAVAMVPSGIFGQAAPVVAAPPVVAVAAAVPLPGLEGSDKVGPVILRDETVAQVLELLQRWTGKSVLRPQALPASLYTLTLPANISRDEALLAIETLLNLNGVAVIQQGEKFLKVVPNLVAKGESPTLITESTLKLSPSGRIASKIFTLKHANAQEFAQQIASSLNNTLGSPPVFFGRNNALLITDSITNLQKIENLMLQLDKPQLDVVATKAYVLKSAMATDIVAKLTSMLRTPAAASGAAPFRLSTGTTFLADERTNRVLLLGSADQHDFFDKLIETLDQKSNPNTKTDVIFLRHADAKAVADVVSSLVTGQTTAATRTNGAAKTTTLNRTPVPATVPGVPAAPQNGADEFSSMVTVIPDIRSNSVVVSGTTDDLRLLHDLIDKVDVVLPQVRVEVVIAEVTLTDNDQNGISALGLNVTAGKLTGVNGTIAGGTVGLNPNGTGFATLAPNGTLTGAIGLSSTDRVNNYRVLSVPSITTTHNKEATIFVGESDPVITGTTSSTLTAGTSTSTVTMRDIGIQLKILPLIGKDGAVQMQVSQSVEDIIRTTIVDGNEQPIIGRRTMDSYVSDKSGEIVVMGGLQRITKKKVTTRLGPIPIIGDLLGSTTDTEVRQELVIFMRPYVLNASAVDNLDALSRVEASSVGPEVRKFIDRTPGKPLPAEGNPAAK